MTFTVYRLFDGTRVVACDRCEASERSRLDVVLRRFKASHVVFHNQEKR